jgi:hypothetical protein
MLNETKLTKPLGGWNFVAKEYEVRTSDPRFPSHGSRMAAWPWGPTIHRIDQTGKHIELGELNDLVAAGKLVPIEKVRIGKGAIKVGIAA